MQLRYNFIAMGRPRKTNSPIGSFFKSIFTIVVLSAFVLSISFFVKTLATSDTKELIGYLDPMLKKVNVDTTQVSEVAGTFVTRVTGEKVVLPTSYGESDTPQVASASTERHASYTVALLSDSHGNNDNLTTALKQVSENKVSNVFFLGDFTDLGELESLLKAQSVMEAANLPYFALPGDHDLYHSVGPQNFLTVFNKNYFVAVINGAKFVGLDNSANYTVINSDIMSWFNSEVVDADYVLLSQPLYHPTFDKVMGTEAADVKAQALDLLKTIRSTKVKAIIAGDQHMSSQNVDPDRASLQHIVVGALTDVRNLQTPRYSLMTGFTDGSYTIEDVLLQ
jgi:hypothetical protein